MSNWKYNVKYTVLTFADILFFVSAIMAVNVTVADKHVANTLREVTFTTHFAIRTFTGYTYTAQLTRVTS